MTMTPSELIAENAGAGRGGERRALPSRERGKMNLSQDKGKS